MAHSEKGAHGDHTVRGARPDPVAGQDPLPRFPAFSSRPNSRAPPFSLSLTPLSLFWGLGGAIQADNATSAHVCALFAPLIQRLVKPLGYPVPTASNDLQLDRIALELKEIEQDYRKKHGLRLGGSNPVTEV